MKDLEQVERVGGHPALDFVNTVNGWDGDAPGLEYLNRYADLVRWNQLVGLIGPRGTRALTGGTSRAEPAALRDAHALRDGLHRVFRSLSAGATLPQEGLDRLNEVIRKTVAWRRITADGTAISCGWDFDGAPPSAILGPVAWQAADLLEHGDPARIKACPPDEGCGWLFLDVSKNRSRTWCSMKTCGNAAKVKRFRARRA